MVEKISVCHVVNTVEDTTMAGDLATTQASSEEFDRVGILAWFDVERFRDMELVETVSLDVANTFRLTRAQYAKAKSVLSEYDVAHTHHPHSGFYGKLIANRLGKPVVHTEHNNHNGYTRKGRIANGVTNLLADAVACVSESVRESFFGWEDAIMGDEKVSVIHNGVDIERLEAARKLEWNIHDVVDIDPDAVVVGSAGMLTEQKGHEVLLDAVDRANEVVRRPIELVISGRGPLRETLERGIAEAQFPDRLHLLGFLEARDHVYKMLHDIDVYSMPSRWEGFCVAALEAMAAENPCVFSNIPAFEIPFGNSARYHPVDDAEALANVLIDLVESPSERRELAQRGRQLVVDNYSLRSTVDAYLDWYRKHVDS